MDRKSEEKTTQKTRKRKCNKKELFKFVPLLLVLGGLVMIGRGALILHKMNNEIGYETVEELNEDIKVLSEEYEKVNTEKNAEFEKNGFSDKYFELEDKASGINVQISKATASRYSKETGFENPDSFGDIMVLIPSIPAGVLVVMAGVVLQVVLTAKKKETKK